MRKPPPGIDEAVSDVCLQVLRLFGPPANKPPISQDEALVAVKGIAMAAGLIAHSGCRPEERELAKASIHHWVEIGFEKSARDERKFGSFRPTKNADSQLGKILSFGKKPPRDGRPS